MTTTQMVVLAVWLGVGGFGLWFHGRKSPQAKLEEQAKEHAERQRFLVWAQQMELQKRQEALVYHALQEALLAQLLALREKALADAVTHHVRARGVLRSERKTEGREP